MTTLVLTNDFPPRLGGIEAFVAQVCAMLDDDVVVLTSSTPDRAAAERAHDTALGYPVVRRGSVLLPTRTTLSTAVALLRDSGADRVVVGAAAPLGLLAGGLRRAGAGRVVAISHGHEVWWSRVPGAAQTLARIARDVDALTTISAWTRQRIARAVAPTDRHKLVALPPPVDLGRFAPAPPPEGPPTLVSAGRFVPRKNHETLLRAFDRLPSSLGARLLLAGSGPLEPRLRRLAGAGVELVGPLPHDAMPALYARGHVFASPVRTRPLDAEGFGMVFAEAAACGLPVVVGRSGGAPETVVDGVSGIVVDPLDVEALTGALLGLLADPDRARAMGEAGRRHVAQFGAERARTTLRRLLALDPV